MLHGTRIVNGYSGAFPATYNMRLGILRNPFADPGSLAMVLDLDAVTHAVVHTDAYTQNRGIAVVELLEKIGGSEARGSKGITCSRVRTALRASWTRSLRSRSLESLGFASLLRLGASRLVGRPAVRPAFLNYSEMTER